MRGICSLFLLVVIFGGVIVGCNKKDYTQEKVEVNVFPFDRKVVGIVERMEDIPQTDLCEVVVVPEKDHPERKLRALASRAQKLGIYKGGEVRIIMLSCFINSDGSFSYVWILQP